MMVVVYVRYTVYYLCVCRWLERETAVSISDLDPKAYYGNQGTKRARDKEREMAVINKAGSTIAQTYLVTQHFPFTTNATQPYNKHDPNHQSWLGNDSTCVAGPTLSSILSCIYFFQISSHVGLGDTMWSD